MAYFLENCLLMTVAHQFCDVCGIRLSNTIKILLQLVNINLPPINVFSFFSLLIIYAFG